MEPTNLLLLLTPYDVLPRHSFKAITATQRSPEPLSHRRAALRVPRLSDASSSCAASAAVMLNGSAGGERKGTGRVLATKSRRSFASAAPHSYAPLRSTDSAAFDAVLKLFPAANDSQSTPRTSSSHPSSRSLRPPRSSSHSTPLEDDLPPSFLFALDPFKDVPLPVEDEQEEDVEEEAEDEVEDDDDDVSFTRSPFLAPTPSRLSTASSSSSVSARSRRQSGGRPSVSPAQSRSAVSKKLDLTDEDTTQGEAPSSASGRRSSRRSTQGLSVAFAADDDEPPSAGSNRRRSRVSGKEEKETDEQKEEMEDDETKEAPPEADDAGAEMDLEAKYDGDADGDDEADAGDAPMDFNDAGDDDNAAVNGAEQEDDEEEAAAAPSPHKAAPRRPRTQGKSRRETTRLVDEAKRVGMLDDEEATGFGGRRGRPKRHRIEPLRYWENEHITYERTQGGVGNVMPVPKDVVRSSYTSPVRKRKAASRPAAGGRKKGTKTTKVNKQ